MVAGVVGYALEPDAGERLVFGDAIVLTTPGGFDGFFQRLAAAHEAGALGADAYAEASKEYGITWLD